VYSQYRLWSIAAVDYATDEPIIKTLETKRATKSPVKRAALDKFTREMCRLETAGWSFVGHGDDMVKFGEFANLKNPVLNGELALKSILQTCKPSAVMQGSLSLNSLIPAFGIRDEEVHSSEEDSIDMLLVYRALFTDERMVAFAAAMGGGC